MATDQATLEAQDRVRPPGVYATSGERATWYRPDGTAIPNQPMGPYNVKHYEAKGWSLTPPSRPVPPPPVSRDALATMQGVPKQAAKPVTKEARNKASSERMKARWAARKAKQAATPPKEAASV